MTNDKQSQEPGGEMKFSRKLFFFSIMEADVELVGLSWHQDPGGVEVQQSDSADIIGGGVLIENGKLKVNLRAGLNRNAQGLIPNDLDILISFDYLSLVLCSTVPSENLDPNEVLHLTEDVIALLKDGVGNGHLQAGHAQQNILCNIIYWWGKQGIRGEDRVKGWSWFEKEEDGCYEEMIGVGELRFYLRQLQCYGLLVVQYI